MITLRLPGYYRPPAGGNVKGGENEYNLLKLYTFCIAFLYSCAKGEFCM